MKKAIIVGSAGSLLDKENGHLIDTFDVVVRFNDFRILGYEKYCGSKTDITCQSANETLRHMIEKQSDPGHDWWRDNDIPYENYLDTVDTVWYANKREWVENGVTCDEIASISNIVNFEFMDSLDAENPESPFYYVDEDREYDASPSAGLAAMSYIIQASTGQGFNGRPCRLNGGEEAPTTEPHSLAGYRIFITGFDGFATAHYFKSSESPLFMAKQKDTWGTKHQTFGHDAAHESKIVSDLVRSGMVTEL
jgi:hypothetical protein